MIKSKIALFLLADKDFLRLATVIVLLASGKIIVKTANEVLEKHD